MDVFPPASMVRIERHNEGVGGRRSKVRTIRSIAEVLDLPVSFRLVYVDHNDFSGDWIQDERVGDCGAYVAGADDGDF